MVNVTKIDNFQSKKLVYCKLVKTYIDIALCQSGGPMQSAGACDYFKELVRDKDGQVTSLVHAVPTQEAVLNAIIQEQ